MDQSQILLDFIASRLDLNAFFDSRFESGQDISDEQLALLQSYQQSLLAQSYPLSPTAELGEFADPIEKELYRTRNTSQIPVHHVAASAAPAYPAPIASAAAQQPAQQAAPIWTKQQLEMLNQLGEFVTQLQERIKALEQQADSAKTKIATLERKVAEQGAEIALLQDPLAFVDAAATIAAVQQSSPTASSAAASSNDDTASVASAAAAPAAEVKKEHICPHADCPSKVKVFSTSSNLARHIREVHDKVKRAPSASAAAASGAAAPKTSSVDNLSSRFSNVQISK